MLCIVLAFGWADLVPIFDVILQVFVMQPGKFTSYNIMALEKKSFTKIMIS